MKKIRIGHKDYSKIIVGTNAFYGHSHFSAARDSEYKKRFSDDYIKNLLRLCFNKGVNAIETCANERILNIINEFKKEKEINFIGTTRIDETSLMKSHQIKLRYLIENEADICIIHSQFVDRLSSGNEIKGLQSMVDEIHAAGLLAGISTHKNSTIELCEKKYDLDVYLYPMNMLGFVYPGYDGNETVKERTDFIKNTNKQFIVMKTLAAGRIPPKEGLQFVLDNIKDNDIITLGLGSMEETEESIDFVNLYLSDK
jgi:aryl-alcohol dehydrogenase-like predicted oxidoreductase